MRIRFQATHKRWSIFQAARNMGVNISVRLPISHCKANKRLGTRTYSKTL